MAKILKCIKCTALLLLGYTCLAPGASTVASIVDETSSLRSHQCKATEDDIDVKAIDQTCPSVAETSTNHAPKRKKLEVVTFTAQEEVRSAVLPVLPAHASSTSNSAKSHHKHHNLHKFFTATENIDLQFADRAEVHHITHPSQELMDTFHRLNAQRRLEAGLAPTSTHLASTQTRIVGLTNPPMHCLGLILHSVTHVGIQTFVDGEYPEVHLTLMETEFEATGPQFLVHLFDKIMLAHEDNNTGGKQKAVETIGFTREFMYSILLMLHNISSSTSRSDIVSLLYLYRNMGRAGQEQ